MSCPTLCDPLDYSLLASSVHGVFQAKILDWVAISFSNDLYVLIFKITAPKRKSTKYLSIQDRLVCRPSIKQNIVNTVIQNIFGKTYLATWKHTITIHNFIKIEKSPEGTIHQNVNSS